MLAPPPAAFRCGPPRARRVFPPARMRRRTLPEVAGPPRIRGVGKDAIRAPDAASTAKNGFSWGWKNFLKLAIWGDSGVPSRGRGTWPDGPSSAASSHGVRLRDRQRVGAELVLVIAGGVRRHVAGPVLVRLEGRPPIALRSADEFPHVVRAGSWLDRRGRARGGRNLANCQFCNTYADPKKSRERPFLGVETAPRSSTFHPAKWSRAPGIRRRHGSAVSCAPMREA